MKQQNLSLPARTLCRFTALFAVLLGSVGSAFAGAITITDMTPDPTVTGALVQNSANFNATQPTPDAVKIFGLGNFTNNGTNTGDGTIRIAVSGMFTAQGSDRLFADYDFTITRNGSTTSTVTYAVTGNATANFGGFPVPISASQGGTVMSGTQTYSGSIMSAVNPLGTAVSGTFTGFLEITVADGVAGDTLAINIPNNSIDFRISTVPEPASFGLIGVGAVLLARRRRA